METNFINLPVERGLDILRTLSSSQLLGIVATVPAIYLKYRDFLPELAQDDLYVYVLLQEQPTEPWNYYFGPLLTNHVVVFEHFEDKVEDESIYHSIDVVGTYTTMSRTIEEAITYLRQKNLLIRELLPNDPDVIEQLRKLGLTIVKVLTGSSPKNQEVVVSN